MSNTALDVQYRLHYRDVDEVCTEYVPLLEQAWNECIEYQVMDINTFVQHSLMFIHKSERIELLAYSGTVCIAALVLVSQIDMHVGRCASVMYNYVDKQHRNKSIALKLLKEAMWIAKRLGHTTIVYTHRIGVGTYNLRYRRI